jgi:3-dehydroquinate dehydratase-2
MTSSTIAAAGTARQEPGGPRRVLLLNGPNLNLLGERDPAHYGTDTLAEIEDRVRSLGSELGVEVDCAQSNSEGELVTLIHNARKQYDGIIINPGAFAIYSYALRDAIAAIIPPVVEVHIANIYARESFRHHSVTAAVVNGIIAGCGTAGYDLALRCVITRIDERRAAVRTS